jgi:3-oxoacid CoA-transferase subunit B
VYTELAVIDLSPHGATLVELAPNVAFDDVQSKTGFTIAR